MTRNSEKIGGENAGKQRLEAPQPPRGFCPGCDYPMDPGTCPECGKIVTEGLLSLRSQRVLRRRRGRQWLAVGVAVITAAASWYTYVNVKWPPHLPTWILFQLQKRPSDAYGAELYDRLLEGRLNAEQARRLLTLSTNLSVVTTGPLPYDCPIPLFIETIVFGQSISEGGLVGLMTNIDRSWISVDGKPADVGNDYIAALRDSLGRFADGECGLTNPMPPGKHRISLRQRVTIDPMVGVLPGLPLQLELLDELEIEVGNSPVRDIVSPCWSASAAEQMQHHALLLFSQRTESGADSRITVSLSHPPCNVVGELWVRPANQREYRPVPMANCILFGAYGTSVGFSTSEFPWDLHPDAVDVQLRPNFSLAYVTKRSDIFDGVIEWRDVPITSRAAGADASPIISRTPTRVFRMEAPAQP